MLTLTDPSGFYGYTATYNVDNRMSSVVTTYAGVPTTSTFVYDGDGGRVKKIDGTTTTRYISKLYECDTTGANTSCSRFVWAGDIRIATVATNGTTHYWHGDHLGSSSVITDSTGAKVQALTYYPYGDVRTNVPGTPVNVPYKFTGQELDFSSNLYFYESRYYHAIFGRFISPDTIVPDPLNPQDLNRYSYVRNSPLNYTDSTGSCPSWMDYSPVCNESLGGPWWWWTEPTPSAGWTNPQLDIIYLGDTTSYYPDSGSTRLSVKGQHVSDRADGTLVMPEFSLSFSGGSRVPHFDVGMHYYDQPSTMDWAQQGLGIAENLPHSFVTTQNLDRGGAIARPVGLRAPGGSYEDAKYFTPGVGGAFGAARSTWGGIVQDFRTFLRTGQGSWALRTSMAESAKGLQYKGGVSIQDVWVNEQAGVRLYHHQIFRDGKVLHETFRPYGK
jgi:RHS repeat-associated protein